MGSESYDHGAKVPKEAGGINGCFVCEVGGASSKQLAKNSSTVSKVGDWNSRLFCVGSKPRNSHSNWMKDCNKTPLLSKR